MAIKQAAKRALRKNLKSRIINTAKKTEIKDLAKQIRELAAAGKIEDAKKQMSAYFQMVDKSAKTGIFKKNAAARKKSQISKLFRPAK